MCWGLGPRRNGKPKARARCDGVVLLGCTCNVLALLLQWIENASESHRWKGATEGGSHVACCINLRSYISLCVSGYI